MEGRRLDGSPIRVLIVDDSLFIAKQLGQILASEGYEIIATAVDGKEGLDTYTERSSHIDLVTMDITMPRMDGLTALKKILDFDKKARVIVISALGKEDLVKQAIMTGAKNFIVKPLDRTKVLERISAVCADLR
jgi:two-component system chemotaxis response regulator CheY